jgi:DTW domain-containing protein
MPTESSRKKPADRCKTCLMRREHCLCSDIPSINISTKIILVVSKREIIVPTNTGRLACQALKNSVILIRGDRDHPIELKKHIDHINHALVLYPSDDAEQLTPEFVATLPRPLTLVVPDGNWRQTYKMRRRDPTIAALRPVTLVNGSPSQYRVRHETKAGGLATIEAIARALGILEGPDVQRTLETIMNIMVSRTMASRGLQNQSCQG